MIEYRKNVMVLPLALLVCMLVLCEGCWVTRMNFVKEYTELRDEKTFPSLRKTCGIHIVVQEIPSPANPVIMCAVTRETAQTMKLQKAFERIREYKTARASQGNLFVDVLLAPITLFIHSYMKQQKLAGRAELYLGKPYGEYTEEGDVLIKVYTTRKTIGRSVVYDVIEKEKQSRIFSNIRVRAKIPGMDYTVSCMTNAQGVCTLPVRELLQRYCDMLTVISGAQIRIWVEHSECETVETVPVSKQDVEAILQSSE